MGVHDPDLHLHSEADYQRTPKRYFDMSMPSAEVKPTQISKVGHLHDILTPGQHCAATGTHGRHYSLASVDGVSPSWNNAARSPVSNLNFLSDSQMRRSWYNNLERTELCRYIGIQDSQAAWS